MEVQAAARLEASNLAIQDMQYAGLEVSGTGSVSMAAGGTVCDLFLSPEEMGLDREQQRGVHVHSEGSVQLSRVRSQA